MCKQPQVQLLLHRNSLRLSEKFYYISMKMIIRHIIHTHEGPQVLSLFYLLNIYWFEKHLKE